MEKLKKNWHLIVIAILLIFGLSKCSQSCNRQTTIDKQNVELAKRDSTIKIMNDSIVSLSHKIDLLTNDKTNQEKLVETQQDAINKINEAKKNINVKVTK